MNIEIAATYCEFEDINVTAADIDDKIRRVAESQRGNLTVEKLLAMMDQRHGVRASLTSCPNKFNPRGAHFHVSLKHLRLSGFPAFRNYPLASNLAAILM